jgi:hypothetical protein
MLNQQQIDAQQKEAATQLDQSQEDVMAARSSDGRPPPSKLMRKEWRWFGIGGVLVFSALVVWMVVSRASPGSVVAGIAYVVLLLAAASPVLGAGLLRGGEERAAHKAVRNRLTDRHAPEHEVGDRAMGEGQAGNVVVTADAMEFHDPVPSAYSTQDVPVGANRASGAAVMTRVAEKGEGS